MAARGAPVNAIPPAKWPWAVGAVVLLVLVAVIWYAATNGEDNPAPGGTDPSSSTSPTTEPASTEQADGCLGGEGDLAEAVLTAQQEASLTGNGAAAFLATVLRWMSRSSLSQEELDAVGEQIWSPDIGDEWTTRESPPEEGASGQPVFSFEDALYRVEEISESTASVAVLPSVEDSDPGRPIVLRAVALGGTWRFAGYDEGLDGTVTLQQLRTNGQPFREGC